jgi:Protein of unknown function (DUF616)
VRIWDARPTSPSDRKLLEQSSLFDPAFYLAQYPDVAAAGIDPVQHYLAYGSSESRRPHPAFDGAWYLQKNPDVRRSGLNPLVHYLREGAAGGRRAHKRTVVYTAVTGLWDDLRVPSLVDPEIDYIVFADVRLPPPPAPWVRRGIRRRQGNDRLTSRFIKVTPHIHLPEYELSLWMDAAYQLRNVTEQILEELAGSMQIATFRHSQRNCAYAEAEVVRTYKLDSGDNVDRTVAHLKAHGFPSRAGLCETGLVLRRHQNRDLIRAMEQWWDTISRGSCRDQLSFNFALWQNQLPYAVLPGIARRNGLAYWMGHRPQTEIELRTRLLEHEHELLLLYQQIEDAAAETRAAEESNFGSAGGSVQHAGHSAPRGLG